MTAKQKLFIEHYINNGMNSTQAAISAGYSKKSAGLIGHENIKKPYIQKAIHSRIKELLSNTELLTLEWLSQVKNIASFDIRKIVKWDESGNISYKPSNEIDDATAWAMNEISQTVTENGGTTKMKAESKTKALELLGKYLAILNENPPEYKDGVPNAQQMDAEERRERIAELTRKLNSGSIKKED